MADVLTKTTDIYLRMQDYVFKLLQTDPMFVSESAHSKQTVAGLIKPASLSHFNHDSARVVPNLTKGGVFSIVEKLSLSEVPKRRIVATCVIASVFLAKTLKEIASNNAINTNEKNRRFARAVTSSVMGILFSLYGSLAGQSLIKNQAVGRVVGSILGTIVGRTIGGAIAEVIYNVFH